MAHKRAERMNFILFYFHSFVWPLFLDTLMGSGLLGGSLGDTSYTQTTTHTRKIKKEALTNFSVVINNEEMRDFDLQALFYFYFQLDLLYTKMKNPFCH